MTSPPTVGTPAHLLALEALWADAELDPLPRDPRRRSLREVPGRLLGGMTLGTAPIAISLGLALSTLVGGAGVVAAVTLHGAGPTAASRVGRAVPLSARGEDEAAAELHELRSPLPFDTRPVAPAATPRSEPSQDPPSPAEPAPALGPALPTGKGMWIWKPELTEGGNVAAIVTRAKEIGLSHLYVRTGSSVQGFHGAEFLDQILPAAHAAGIAVYGWDFPYFRSVPADVDRALEAVRYRTGDGHAIDGFVPDIETPAEGTHLTVENATAYSHGLRAAVGPDYPLLVAVPRPSEVMVAGRYPYDAVVEVYDAIIPMVYWLNRQPDTDVAGALGWLGRYGKPIIPVGQAYDGAPEGGRPGPPTVDEIRRFLTTAAEHGATGVSFWSWQHATDEIWSAYAAASEFADSPPAPRTRDR